MSVVNNIEAFDEIDFGTGKYIPRLVPVVDYGEILYLVVNLASLW